MSHLTWFILKNNRKYACKIISWFYIFSWFLCLLMFSMVSKIYYNHFQIFQIFFFYYVLPIIYPNSKLAAKTYRIKKEKYITTVKIYPNFIKSYRHDPCPDTIHHHLPKPNWLHTFSCRPSTFEGSLNNPSLDSNYQELTKHRFSPSTQSASHLSQGHHHRPQTPPVTFPQRHSHPVICVPRAASGRFHFLINVFTSTSRGAC